MPLGETGTGKGTGTKNGKGKGMATADRKGKRQGIRTGNGKENVLLNTPKHALMSLVPLLCSCRRTCKRQTWTWMVN
jgi:hypothetical protein